ncbi:MAG TPA: hypothetical protein VGO07_06110 [Candidatus Saccharimonadales bacterium]|nr:hypothetical protein [Candidatus Saccharimonadales bacterium]
MPKRNHRQHRLPSHLMPSHRQQTTKDARTTPAKILHPDVLLAG